MDARQPSDQSLLERLNALKPTSVSLGKAPNTISAVPGVAGVASATQTGQPTSREDALSERLRILRKGSASNAKRQSAGADIQDTQPPSERSKTASLNDSANQLAVVTQVNAGQAETWDDPYLTFETGDLDDLLDDFDLDHELDEDNDKEEDIQDSRTSEILEPLKPPEPDPNKLKSSGDNSEDDSDGETMSRDVERLLAQVRDEISIDNKDPNAKDGAAAPNEASTTSDSVHPDLTLPGVPSSQPVDPTTDQAEDDGGGGTARESPDFFEKDITTRLASLRGLGSGVNLDPFGFPTAPQFKPEDRSASTAASLITKRGGYTDEDQKTWCIVCLDDATVRCVGCDNDVYCSRCWKDMHSGPSAGYDERGHKWVKFQG